MSIWRKGDIVYLWPVTEKDWKKHDKMLKKSGGTKGYLKQLGMSPRGEELYKSLGLTPIVRVVSPKRPIAYSTQSTLEWLTILKEESHSWEDMYKLASGEGKYLRDEESLSVINALMMAEIDFSEYKFR